MPERPLVAPNRPFTAVECCDGRHNAEGPVRRDRGQRMVTWRADFVLAQRLTTRDARTPDGPSAEEDDVVGFAGEHTGPDGARDCTSTPIARLPLPRFPLASDDVTQLSAGLGLLAKDLP